MKRAVIVLVAAMTVLPGCPEDEGKAPSINAAGEGRKIEVRGGTPAPKSAACGKCGKPAGEGHACGASSWCESCGFERSLSLHDCGLSRFCGECGKEKSLLDHRCGETSWCPKCRCDALPGHGCGN